MTKGTEWERMKQKIREVEWAKLKAAQEVGQRTPGTVTSKAVPPEAPSGPAETPTPTTSVTSVTATAPLDLSTSRIASSTSAESISMNGSEHMDWTMSPIGFVETGCGTSTITLDGLPPQVRESLSRLAAGRNEPVGGVIQQICEFFIVEESEWAEASLRDALIFYTDNYTLKS